MPRRTRKSYYDPIPQPNPEQEARVKALAADLFNLDPATLKAEMVLTLSGAYSGWLEHDGKMVACSNSFYQEQAWNQLAFNVEWRAHMGRSI